MTLVTSKEKKTYTDNILNQHGVKTTSINTKKGEATFVDYSGALNDKTKNAILNGGFGENDGWDDAELAMQEDIANLYRSLGKSNIQTSDLIKMLKSAGYSVESTYMSTSYITDNKASGVHLGATNGAINILTITDKNGNDIVIADANGNAAIETEELFLNEILTGAVSMIDGVDYSQFNTGKTSSEMSTFDKISQGFGLTEFDFENIFKNDNKFDKLSEKEKEEEINKKLQEEKAKLEKEEEKKSKLTEINKATYRKIMEKFIENYIEDYDKNDLSEKELEKLAQKEAKEHMEKNYIIV